MKKYQVVENYGSLQHAGSKATNDCSEILSREGFGSLPVRWLSERSNVVSKVLRQLHSLIIWSNLYAKVETDSVLVLQHPFRRKQYGRFSVLKKLKEKKNVKIISIIHDVELIRNIFSLDFYQEEMNQMIQFAHKIIVHNEVMKEWFIQYGVKPEQLEVLEIFDYLIEDSSNKEVGFSKNVYIAGNLSKEKSPYVYQMGELATVHVKLMGINYETKNQGENVDYLGSFAPDDVPNHLTNGFGLVWDGDSLDTCSGPTGNYLRYNNPHKLSLYLASGIPVIVWSESAEAKFVVDNGLGLTVSSLRELENSLVSLTEEEYKQFLTNVQKVSENLKSGQYLKDAIGRSIK
ncbi:TPA: glycosyl transferase [Streptococcus suis]